MWTNYYIRNNICNHCNRYDEEHLWKSSWWRDFSIRHHKDKYNSWNEFKEYLKWKKIFNEYWEEQEYNEFIEIIEIKKKQHPFAHNKWEKDSYWKYIDWYYFLDCDFC